MRVTRAYRYELDPNNVQRTLLAKHAGTARFAWNWALARRIERFKAREGKERFTDAMADHRDWNTWKRENALWTYEVSKCCAQEAFRNLDRAFQAFWRSRKAERTVGFPRFKKKGVRDSFRMTGSIRAEESIVQLPRLGVLRTKEGTRVTGRILSATVTREADRWFVSLTVEGHRLEPPPVMGPVIGMDVGLSWFATLSDGEQIHGPKPLARSLELLRLRSRQHSRRKKGSKNRGGSALRLARLHRRIRNKRRDFLHKLSTRLTKTKSVIVVEDLDVSSILRDRKLSRHIADSGWFEFNRMLTYKARWYGSRLITAPRYYPSSRICSVCGHLMEEMPLGIREWACPECRTIHDRDHNAAMNLMQIGTASWAGTDQGDLAKACGDASSGGTATTPVYEPRAGEAGTEHRLPPNGING